MIHLYLFAWLDKVTAKVAKKKRLKVNKFFTPGPLNNNINWYLTQTLFLLLELWHFWNMSHLAQWQGSKSIQIEGHTCNTTRHQLGLDHQSGLENDIELNNAPYMSTIMLVHIPLTIVCCTSWYGEFPILVIVIHYQHLSALIYSANHLTTTTFVQIFCPLQNPSNHLFLL